MRLADMRLLDWVNFALSVTNMIGAVIHCLWEKRRWRSLDVK